MPPDEQKMCTAKQETMGEKEREEKTFSPCAYTGELVCQMSER